VQELAAGVWGTRCEEEVVPVMQVMPVMQVQILKLRFIINPDFNYEFILA
jgi:hypothetical protein